MEQIYCPYCNDIFSLLWGRHLDCGCEVSEEDIEGSRRLNQFFLERNIRLDELEDQGKTPLQAILQFEEESKQRSIEANQFFESMGLLEEFHS